jgi:glycyl-tRNA synthetase
VLRLAPRLAPFKAAVLPLAKKPELTSVARDLFDALQDVTGAVVDYDETSNIGKRYRRQDEVGTPFCFTVDFDTLEDNAVTVRDRDSMAQERISLAEAPAWLAERIR